jgi:hypothetical protein
MKVTLKDKTELNIDLYALTVGDVRSLLEGKTDKGDKYSREDEIIAKAAGITAEALKALPFPDYRKIIKVFWDCVRDPLRDNGEEKNLVSESISV